ncbi:MAG: FAD binding domain-containing protein, partial [Acetobacteraceae bacterium]|nr:FAD binding domain-containing protein [Acetobacteraceae bacterium]
MQFFTLTHPAAVGAATETGRMDGAAFIAGGTDLMQLMKNHVETPRTLVDLSAL